MIYNQIELRLPFWDEHSRITLVDTPGLNGVADKHRELTLEEVKNAHCCIYILPLRSLSASDLEFINYLTRYQTHFLFVVNGIDELHISEGETPEKKITETQELLRDNVFKDLGDDYVINVCGVSSLKALVASDTSIKRLYQSDTVDITDERRAALYEESRFKTFYQAAQTMLSADVYQEVKNAAVTGGLINLVTRFREDAVSHLEGLVELQEETHEKQRITALIERRDRFVAAKDKKLGGIHNFIQAERANIRRVLSDALDTAITEQNADMKTLINADKDYDQFKAHIDQGFFNKHLQSAIYPIDEQHKKSLEDCLQNLLQNALLRVRESCNWNEAVKARNVTFNLGDAAHEKALIDPFEKDKKDLDNKIESAADEAARAKQAVSNAERKLSEKTTEKQREDQKLADIQRQTQAAISSLGSRPSPKTRYRTESQYRGGFFGSIVDFFSGPKEVTKSETDDSDGEKWDHRDYEIRSEAGRKRAAVEEQKDKLQGEIDKANADRSQDKTKSDMAERKVSRLTQQRDSLVADQQKWEREAHAEMFRERRQKLLASIETYLTEVATARKDVLEKNLEHSTKFIEGEVDASFKRDFNQQVRMLTDAIEGKTDELQKPFEEWQTALKYYDTILSTNSGL
jgi:hypothetical protein